MGGDNWSIINKKNVDKDKLDRILILYVNKKCKFVDILKKVMEKSLKDVEESENYINEENFTLS